MEGGIAGVIQAINKREGIFGALDEEVLRMLAVQSGTGETPATTNQLVVMKFRVLTSLCLFWCQNQRFKMRSTFSRQKKRKENSALCLT